MFRISISAAASKSCGINIVGACCGGKRRTCWWMQAVMEAIRLREAFRAWLSQGSPEAAGRYRVAKRAAALVVAKAKTQVWEEFGENMENDFWLASRMFWQTIRQI